MPAKFTGIIAATALTWMVGPRSTPPCQFRSRAVLVAGVREGDKHFGDEV